MLPKDGPLIDSPTLTQLKARGKRAFAETRDIISDMERHAADIRRDVATMRLGIQLRSF